MPEPTPDILEPYRRYLTVLASVHLDPRLRGKLDPADIVQQVMTRAVAAVSGLRSTEGAVVTANHGDCPLGPLQERLGDPIPLFELVLSPTAARRAVPTLGLITVAGLMLLVRRSPRTTWPAGP